MGSGIDMRPIKFRAWDGERMIYDVQNIYDTIIRLKTADGEDVDQCDTKLPCVSDFGSLLRCEDEDVPIMQFTGLLDKNGKEIYEGDILNSHNGTLQGFVFYQGPSFVVKRQKSAKTWVEFILHPTEKQFQEIIGNIHETPELVK